jgi:membrane-associated phospholipid phosphatase
MRWKWGATWLVLACFALTTAAQAGDRVELDQGWPARWRRVGPEETIAIGGLAAASIALQLFLNAPDQPRWDSAILFDDGARNALRASSESGRSRAAAFSNAAYVLTAVPFIVDAGLVTWLGHGQVDAAMELALIDFEALAMTTLLTTALQRGTGRARPFNRECATNPSSDPDCAGSGNSRNTSFISGHASLAFSAATTLCVQHARLSLYGSADPVVCPAALTIAAGSSLLRVVADRHWISDVIAGAALGSAVGYVVSAVHLSGDGSAPAGLTMGEQGRSVVYWRAF